MSTEAKVGAFLFMSMIVLGITVYFVQTRQAVRGIRKALKLDGAEE